MIRDFDYPGTHVVQFDSSNVVIPAAGNTEVQSLILNGVPFSCTAEILNTDTADDFDGFDIQAKVHPNSDWAAYITGGEMTTGTALPGRLNRVVGDPAALAFGAVATVQFEGIGLYAVRFTTSGDTNPSSANVRGHVVHLG